MNKFRAFWKKDISLKSHDVGIQAELDEVKEDVHTMDEQLDSIEEESKPKKQKGMHKSMFIADVCEEAAKELKKLDVPRYEAQSVLYDIAGVKMFGFEICEVLDRIYGKEEDLVTSLKSSNISKPGQSIHTDKWDKCVAEVKASSPDADPFAVCTAQLGDESFKSQFRHLAYAKALVKSAKLKVEKIGIAGAGPVPESLLARQDLEGEAAESEEAIEDGEGIIRE